MLNETICAVSSASKEGAISIVRLCGSGAYDTALKLSKKTSLNPRHATLSYIYDLTGKPLDSAILVYFKAPFSFNGEDIVEIQCHGGTMSASLILNRCLEGGARLAEPGEFTKLAVLNSKITIDQAEAINQLISATSEKSAKYLAKHLQGSLGKMVEEMRASLIEALSFSEVCIDYADEDLPQDTIDRLKQKITQIADKLDYTVRASTAREGLFQGFKVSIIGKPNVGKSSLLNKILNFDRAIVSSIAGTTRDTIEEQIKIGGFAIRLVDTAGIRHTEDEIEKIGIEYSIKAFNDSEIVLALFDSSRELCDEDSRILELIKSDSSKKIIVVFTKSDLPPLIDKSVFSGFSVIEYSKNEDPIKIYKELESILGNSYDFEGDILINKRQIDAAKNAYIDVMASIPFLDSLELEFFSYHIKEAIGFISSITSPYDNEEMLDSMFKNFCLGK
ncbi:MAG: tRNA uridine-5-carboxymethylaminomethyl(34) synthesis GTPase MnmE [Campylobacterales bacterium]|nr:tRNA uridine-5-carboxymethylaminomethyl(34) synthesis GTPase MnmE [Campylobacterales bacterium]